MTSRNRRDVLVSKERLQRYKSLLQERCFTGDPEIDHGHADGILCELLDELGYGDIAVIFSKVGKWYA